jgi:hypothetical protein
MEELVQKIRESGKEFLAEIIATNHSKTVHEYSEELLSHAPQKEIEQDLLDAFKEELDSRSYSKETIEKVLRELTNHRVLQTSPHTSLVPNPRMFCIDWICTRALPKDRLYIVGSFSGVPFSNSAKPGRVTGVNFVPKTHQDALVYESPIFEKSLEVFKKEGLTETVSPEKASSFSEWACANSEHLHRKTITENLVYLDINNVITRYLIKIIYKQDHPIYKLLFNETWRKIFMKHFGKHTHLFYGGYKNKKYRKQESLYFDGYDLSGDYQEIRLAPEELEEKLKDRSLCPATVITFTVLTFLNDFKCLGSFMQVEYLSKFKANWEKAGLLGNISKTKTKNLSTGQFPNFAGTARDFLESETPLPDPNDTDMKHLWDPMKGLFVK